MTRLTRTLRFLSGTLTPGGVLLLAAWAVQREDVVRHAVGPYAVYFCFGALAAAVLLSWYYDQSRLLCIAFAVVLTVSALERWPAAANGAKLAAIVLLPLNFILFALWRDRGVITLDGFFKIAIVVVQVFGVIWIAREHADRVGAFLDWDASGAWPGLPWPVQLSFAIAAVTLLTLVFVRRTKVEQGLLWALAAVFLGLQQIVKPDALIFFWGTAGLILLFAVLEHGYEIAYRDELTGLPGRRAFNNIMMGQLGGTYAIAMCDVDHFKTFNDTYGHDAGDQVLKMVAENLSRVGGGGRAFRYGGEEFLIVFRGRSANDAKPSAESLCKTIADAGFVPRGPDRPDATSEPLAGANQQGSTPGITVSIGIAEKSNRHSTPELVLEAADAALYRAKRAGRNCVKLDESTQNYS